MPKRGKKKLKLSEVSLIELPTYTPRRMTQDDWNDAEGEPCPLCGKLVERLIHYGYYGKRKACPECMLKRRKLMEYKSRIAKFKARRR